MQTVNLYDAKNKLSQLVNAAEKGEVIIVARNGKPAAKLVPLDYGERREWSAGVQSFLQSGAQHDPTAFDIDRSDLLPLREPELD